MLRLPHSETWRAAAWFVLLAPMSSEADKERRQAIERVRPHGWYVAGQNPKTGYTRMFFSCGVHKMWLPKTPSSPYTYRNKASRMISVCSTQRG